MLTCLKVMPPASPLSYTATVKICCHKYGTALDRLLASMGGIVTRLPDVTESVMLHQWPSERGVLRVAVGNLSILSMLPSVLTEYLYTDYLG